MQGIVRELLRWLDVRAQILPSQQPAWLVLKTQSLHAVLERLWAQCASVQLHFVSVELVKCFVHRGVVSKMEFAFVCDVTHKQRILRSQCVNGWWAGSASF